MKILRAAGTLIIAQDTGRVLLLRRADGEGWSHPGGLAEPGESPAETAHRELEEETGIIPIVTECLLVLRLARHADGSVSVVGGVPEGDDDRWETAGLPEGTVLLYYLFVVTLPEELAPILDGEHVSWSWGGDVPLHPGCEAALAHLEENTWPDDK